MPEGATTILDDEQNRRFSALAQKTRKTVPNLIHQALEEFLDRHTPKPKSTEQIRNERDATLIQLMRDTARKHDVQTEDVRRDFGTMNATQLRNRYKFTSEVVKEIQNYLERTQTAKK
jgi:predicted transcriptional regulator